MGNKAKNKKEEIPAIGAFKAFDNNMQCRSFQFEEGKTYHHEGDVKICESGFHSCENPLDTLDYYCLCESRFAQVIAGGEIKRHGNDSKIASTTITINAEIKLPEFIRASVDWLLNICKGVAAASGDSSQLAASGDSSQLAASGNYSQLAASGDYSQLAASGDSSQLAASGHSSQLAASGHSSQLAASGDYSQLAASGNSSIVMAAALGCRAKVGVNGAIALPRWVKKEKRYRISVAYVGEKGIKPDTWYQLDNKGHFVEVLP